MRESPRRRSLLLPSPPSWLRLLKEAKDHLMPALNPRAPIGGALAPGAQDGSFEFGET